MVLDEKLWTRVPENELGGAWVELIAARCPASQRQKLHDQLTDFDRSQTMIPLALLEILDGMENDRTHV